MKKRAVVTIAVMTVVIAAVQFSSAQTVNWRAMHVDQHNVVQFNFGYESAMTAQVGYGRTFTLLRPALFVLDYSVPMGDELLDDFRVRLGAQFEVVEIGGFSATLRILGSLRRYENPLVRIVSFGSDFAAVVGYYDAAWYAAGEFGFDKAVTSHLKHSDLMKTAFPEIKEGWYIPTGGHYYYGIQGGKTIGESLDLSLRLGATNAQDDDEDAAMIYYAQLGLGVRF